MITQKKQKMEGLGLDSIGDLSGLLDDSDSTKSHAGPLELALCLIDEDPNQPRTEDNPGFSKERLEELAATIRHRGVKTPISVREKQDEPGRFIINHGARRYRGSQIANKETIPAFIDNDYNEADQVIENLQRNELTAREIADYIGRELAKGAKKGEIASSIGKSAAFVSQHTTLLDLPEPIAKAFNSSRVNDVTVINELVKAYKKNPSEVVLWLNDDDQELTRGSVKLLREYLDDKHEDEKHNSNIVDVFTKQTDAESDSAQEKDKNSSKHNSKEQDPDKLKKAIVMVKHNERMGRIMLNRRPSSNGWSWIKYEDDGYEFEADLGTVKLMALIDGA